LIISRSHITHLISKKWITCRHTFPHSGGN